LSVPSSPGGAGAFELRKRSRAEFQVRRLTPVRRGFCVSVCSPSVCDGPPGSCVCGQSGALEGLRGNAELLTWGWADSWGTFDARDTAGLGKLPPSPRAPPKQALTPASSEYTDCALYARRHPLFAVLGLSQYQCVCVALTPHPSRELGALTPPVRPPLVQACTRRTRARSSCWCGPSS